MKVGVRIGTCGAARSARSIAAGSSWLAVLVALAPVLLACARSGLDLPDGDGDECRMPSSACAGGICADLSHDPAHCGSCERSCRPGELCDDGECVDACDDGEAICRDESETRRCVDPTSDPEHCGGCGQACVPGAACVRGECLCDGVDCDAPCAPGEITCRDSEGAAVCTDVSSDPFNCGSCDRACTDGAQCREGQCLAPRVLPCAEPLSTCRTAMGVAECVDVSRSDDHCGACGVECGVNSVCVDGECRACTVARFIGHVARPAGPLGFERGPRPLIVDLDGDGLREVITANRAGSSLSLHSANELGELGERELIDTLPSPVALAAGDLDLDGDVDLVVGGSGGVMIHLSDGRVSTWRETIRGDATWPDDARAVAIADVTGDTFPEIVVLANVGTAAQIWLLPGVRSGRRSPTLLRAWDTTHSRLKVADFDGDGREDIAAWGRSADMLWGLADGTWRAQPGWVVFSSPQFVPVDFARLDGDERLDLVTAEAVGQGTLLFGHYLRTHLANATGGFTPVVTNTPAFTGNDVMQVEFGDFRGDGGVQLFSREVRSSVLISFESRGDGTFELASRSAIPASAAGFATGHLDADPHLDVVALHGDANAISTHRGLDDGTFDSYLLKLPEATHLRSARAQRYADRERPLLAVVGGLDAGSFRVLGYDGTNVLTLDQEVKIYRPESLSFGDVDGDGNADALISSERATYWLRYEGRGVFSASPEQLLGSYTWQDALAGDTDGDGVPEVVVMSQDQNGSAVVHVLSRTTSGGGWSDATIAAGNATRIAGGDVTGDGLLDFVTTNGGELRVYRGVAGGTPELARTITDPGLPYYALIHDLDADGVADILGGGFLGYAAYRGGPAADFVKLGAAERPLLYDPFPPSNAFVTSFGDGSVDLVESERDGVIVLWKGTTPGTFEQAERYLVPGGRTAVASEDFDGDGISDLLLTGSSEYDGSLLLMRGAVTCD